MKIKSNISVYILFVIIGLNFFGSSCQEKDLFDSSAYAKMLADSFPVTNIDPNQNWKTVGTASVSATVNDNTNETYKIKIYSENPIFNENATLLAEKDSVADGTTWTGTVDYPMKDSVLYVARIDQSERRMVIPARIKNGTISVVFGTAVVSTKSRAYTRATDEYSILTQSAPYTATDIATMLNKASDATTVANLNQGGNTIYYIAKNYIGNINFWGSSTPYKLIITKKWTLNVDQPIYQNLEIIVASGGELVIPSGISLNSSSNTGNLTVLNGGKVTSYGTINFNSGGSNYNGGSITSNILENNGGTFYNADESSFNVTNLEQNSNGTFINHSSDCTVGNVSATWNSNVENSCKMTITGSLACKSIVLGNGASITCNILDIGGGALKLNENSILSVSSDVSFNGVTISGPTTGSAIFKFGYFKSSNNATSSGSIYYDISNYSSDWGVNSVFLRQPDLIMVDPGCAPLIIYGSSCSVSYVPNEKGNNNDSNDKNFSLIYTFEDNYPKAGDYDFNDVVLKILKTRLSSTKVKLVVTLKAVGASKRNAAGIRLSGLVQSDINSVELSDNGFGTQLGYLFKGNNNLGLDKICADETRHEVVIPLFDDAHYALLGYTPSAKSRFMYNTQTNGNKTQEKSVTIIIDTKKSTTADSITAENLDPFITYYYASQVATRIEVHTYPWKNDATANGYIFDKTDVALDGKAVWAICTPGTFSYPAEYVGIEKAYPNFSKWAADMTTYTDWYNSPSSTSSYIYK